MKFQNEYHRTVAYQPVGLNDLLSRFKMFHLHYLPIASRTSSLINVNLLAISRLVIRCHYYV